MCEEFDLCSKLRCAVTLDCSDKWVQSAHDGPTFAGICRGTDKCGEVQNRGWFFHKITWPFC